MSRDAAELLASYLEAIGTVAAVALALFLQVVLVRLRRPQLSVSFDDELDKEDVVLLRTDTYMSVSVRIKVHARAGKNSVERAGARLLQIRGPGTGAGPSNRPREGTMPWAGSLADSVDIPAGVWQRLDLFFYRQNDDDREAILWPALHFLGEGKSLNDYFPPPMRDRLGVPGKYEMLFVVHGKDADPVFCRFLFDYEPHETAVTETELAGHIMRPRVEQSSRPFM